MKVIRQTSQQAAFHLHPSHNLPASILYVRTKIFFTDIWQNVSILDFYEYHMQFRLNVYRVEKSAHEIRSDRVTLTNIFSNPALIYYKRVYVFAFYSHG